MQKLHTARAAFLCGFFHKKKLLYILILYYDFHNGLLVTVHIALTAIFTIKRKCCKKGK